MTQRFFIETFGCQMNEHDSEKIAGLLAHRGMTPAQNVDEADVFLLNTCSVREKAAQKVYARLGEIKARKRRQSDFIIGVVGCVAQQEGKSLAASAPFVDLVVGTHMYHALPDLVEDVRRYKAPSTRCETQFLKEAAPVEIPRALRQTAFRASVTIMEGCNKRCSFCIVPYTRGRERNRPSDLILEECRRLADEGYVEIVLLGQTVNSYRDLREPRLCFADLLGRVASIPGIRRVRFTSPHPRDFNDDTIRVIGSCENICNQVHLPVQSGSSSVLTRMRRQYSRDWYLELIEKFNACPRPIRFSTDIIVGFPGETEEDFEQTLSLLEKVEFESVFSFKYSPRPHTAAFEWTDDVPEEEKARRLQTLQRLQRNIQTRLHQERYLGRCFEVLVEGLARDGRQRCGRTGSNKVVNFLSNDPPGMFAEVMITHAGPNSLSGSKVQCLQLTF
ncbi:MAG: tRNA (N6-isopentenyl adenosine(37)-C2)-methylthiotransferase MiaB [Acidobacteria bacterium]|nr:tRNA (N6-isopentenyl adenosine(37)-C2)-methylthiotransferase MiaB [Acidobacteriota bacterium]